MGPQIQVGIQSANRTTGVQSGFPFVIVAINILIAVVSDCESAIARWGHHVDLHREGVTLYGGSGTPWPHVFNPAWPALPQHRLHDRLVRIYASKKKDDMLWPDMTWVFIVAYDLWNFCYTYNCLPPHAWYCGLALLLAPTVANFFWNKGGWIQKRANTLAIWCMFAAGVPDVPGGLFHVLHTQSVNNPNVNLCESRIIALAAHVLALGYILLRAKKQGINLVDQGSVPKAPRITSRAIRFAPTSLNWRPSLALSLRPNSSILRVIKWR